MNSQRDGRFGKCVAAAGLVFCGLMFGPGPAQSRELVLGDPADGVLASHRIACGSQKEGHVEYGVWRGKIFGRVAWEQDRHLFDFVGVNARRCPTVVHKTQGKGYRLVSREFAFFLEPGTENILEVWENPYTGKEVSVMPIMNDPVNFPPVLPIDGKGNPYRFSGEVVGNYVVRSLQVPFYYPNPLAGGFSKEIGGYAQGMEVYTHFVPKEELLTDAESPLQNLSVSWYRFSNWMPWMEMGDRPGYLIFSTYGWRVKSIDDLPEILRTALDDEKFALYREPPPATDTRFMTDEFISYREAKKRDRKE